MSDSDKSPHEREMEALDALIVAAYSHDLCDEDSVDLKRLSDALTPEDRNALKTSGDDFIRDLFRNDATFKERTVRPQKGELSTAMNRGTGEDLSPAAREEMDRKAKEAEEAERKKKEAEDKKDQDDRR